MARTEAVGDEPIVFFTGDGRQIFLPVDDIFFDGAAVGSKTEPSSPSDPLGKWLKYLVAQGRLAAAPTLAPGPAMVFTAVGAGSTGNNIVVTVTANGATTVDITVTEADTYEGLTLDSISPNYLPKVLGVTGTPGTLGTRPGLVRVKPITGSPPDPDEDEEDANPVLPVANHTPTWTVAGVAAGTTSFTLEARGPGSDLGQPPHQPKWTIKVDDVVQPPTGKKTFTLKVEWTNTVTVEAGDLGVDPDTSGSKLFPLAFATTITKPDGTNLKLPRPGAVTLRGGAEAAEATKAKATLLANA